MVDKRSKKFKQRQVEAKHGDKVVTVQPSPSDGVPTWDAAAFSRLVLSSRWEACLDAMCEFMGYFEVYHYRGFSRNDIQQMNLFVLSVAGMLTRGDVSSDTNRAARLISYGHLFSNIVSLSSFQTTDFLLKMLMPEGNLVKLLFAQNARAHIQGSVKSFFDTNPMLASIWYSTYMLGVGCPTLELESNLRKHVAAMDPRWAPINPAVSAPMFTCTYFNQQDAKRAKVLMNASIKRLSSGFHTQVTNNPDPKSIAIITSKWHRNHAVYKSAGPLVEQLIGKYKLTLVHLGAEKPENLVTEGFDSVEQVAFDKQLRLSIPEKVRNNDFQLVYYPDIGMIDEGIWLSNQRLAPIQVCGYGHPETTGCSEIDYYLGGEIEKDAAEWYTEKMVLIPGLGQHPAWPTAPRMNSWTPGEKVRINCVWGPDKYNYTMLKVLETINKNCGTDKHVWRFFPSPGVNRYCALVPFMRDVLAILPNSEFYTDIEYYDYMLEAEHGDFSLNSYPFGGYNTVVESLYLGLPCVTLEGNRYYNRAGNELNRMIGMEELNATNVNEFITIATSMILDPEVLAYERAKLAGIDLKAELFKVGPKHFLNATDHIIANHPLTTNPTLIGEIYGNTQ